MTFNVQKGHFDTRNIKISLPWEDDTPSHTLPSLSRFVPPPPPPPHWESLATPVFVLNAVL